jgi:hypothetical protein
MFDLHVGGRQVQLAILQAVAGHRQVLPTHHTARKNISEPKKSHSRSGLVKELTHRIACRGAISRQWSMGDVHGPL